MFATIRSAREYCREVSAIIEQGLVRHADLELELHELPTEIPVPPDPVDQFRRRHEAEPEFRVRPLHLPRGDVGEMAIVPLREHPGHGVVAYRSRVDDGIERPVRNRVRHQDLQVVERAVRLHGPGRPRGRVEGRVNDLRVGREERDVVPTAERRLGDPRPRLAREDVGDAPHPVHGRLCVPCRDEDLHGPSSKRWPAASHAALARFSSSAFTSR